jgi:CBS domain-containing protein
MTVASILAHKGKKVISGSPSDKLEDIAKILAENRIGAIVIVNSDESVAGIVSERDIVRQIAGQGAAALVQPVSNCMTKKVITCSEDDTVEYVMGIMSTNKFRHLPVVAKGRVQGIISIGDVVQRKIEQTERDAEELKRYIAG